MSVVKAAQTLQMSEDGWKEVRNSAVPSARINVGPERVGSPRPMSLDCLEWDAGRERQRSTGPAERMKCKLWWEIKS
jgi:hypothetical protein